MLSSYMHNVELFLLADLLEEMRLSLKVRGIVQLSSSMYVLDWELRVAKESCGYCGGVLASWCDTQQKKSKTSDLPMPHRR